MADDQSRQLGRKGSNPDDVARELLHEMRTKPDTVVVGTVLKYAAEVREAAMRILKEEGEDEGRLAVLQVLAMMSEQIEDAQKFAIQPREGDAALPDRQTILNSIQRTLTPEQAKVFLDKNEVHEPKLVLVPVTSTDRYTEALHEASQIMEGSLEPYLSEFAQTQLNNLATQAQVEGSQIKSWKFALTEGAQTFALPSWDNGRETHQQRIDRFNGRYASKRITRLDYPSYIALMTQGLRQGKPIDCKYEGDSKKRRAKNTWQYTLLNETSEETIEGENHGLVGAGFWNNYLRLVFLYELNLDTRIGAARFRASVVGEMIEI